MPDKALPNPISVTDFYLAEIVRQQAEILQELRSQRQRPELPYGISELKEPAKPGYVPDRFQNKRDKHR